MQQKQKQQKPKWYVVWAGHAPGVYTTWDAARKQVEGYPGARYKAFGSNAEAMEALHEGAALHTGNKPAAPKQIRMQQGGPVLPSVSVDAACDMTTGVMEYRGVDTGSGEELFRMGPFDDCTNNIGEFLAIVHALGMLKRTQSDLCVYSDSRTALAWLKHKHARTTVARTAGNARAFELMDRAEAWLQANDYPNRVLKWETRIWGENPADFGRK